MNTEFGGKYVHDVLRVRNGTVRRSKPHAPAAARSESEIDPRFRENRIDVSRIERFLRLLPFAVDSRRGRPTRESNPQFAAEVIFTSELARNDELAWCVQPTQQNG